jgi:hypothetical protein
MRYYNFLESLLAIVYLFYVAKNLLWFIEPLKEREEYALLLTWYDAKADHLHQFISSIRPWNKKPTDRGKPIVGGRNMLHATRAIIAVDKLRSAPKKVDFCGAIIDNSSTTNNRNNNVANVQPQGPVAAGEKDDAMTSEHLYTAKSIEGLKTVFLREASLNSQTSFLSSTTSSKEETIHKTPGKEDQHRAHIDTASVSSGRLRPALRKLIRLKRRERSPDSFARQSDRSRLGR